METRSGQRMKEKKQDFITAFARKDYSKKDYRKSRKLCWRKKNRDIDYSACSNRITLVNLLMVLSDDPAITEGLPRANPLVSIEVLRFLKDGDLEHGYLPVSLRCQVNNRKPDTTYIVMGCYERLIKVSKLRKL
ncbi:hypothetical protein Tco_0711415 [Tanacetum coccineum]